MRRHALADTLLRVVFFSWLCAGAVVFAPLLDQKAFAKAIADENSCQAPPIAGQGCPATGNGCAGPCAGTGWSCQSDQDMNCPKGAGGCSGGGCNCNAGSC
jgi:hypothetical protein